MSVVVTYPVLMHPYTYQPSFAWWLVLLMLIPLGLLFLFIGLPVLLLIWIIKMVVKAVSG